MTPQRTLSPKTRALIAARAKACTEKVFPILTTGLGQEMRSRLSMN